MRTARKTTILPIGGGSDGSWPVLIRKGQNVAYCVYAMQRRKDLYGEDAEDFRPERWEEDDLPLKKDSINAAWGYLPFSGGPRVCLGRDFGLVEVSYAIVRILQKFPRMKPGALGNPQVQPWLAYSSHHSQSLKRTAKERQKATLTLSLGDGYTTQCSPSEEVATTC